jgi:tetratricopeptide (TPR) repeat protein
MAEHARMLSDISPDVLLGLAQHYGQQGQLPEAQQLYHYLLNLRPGDAEVWFRYGLLAWKCRRLDEARVCLERAVTLQPESVLYALSCAQLLHSCGKYADAESCYRATLTLDPTSAEACFGLGQVLLATNRSEDARGFHRSAVQKNGNAGLWNDWGTLWEGWNRWPEALACYQQAVAIDPQGAEAQSNLGNALKWSGRPAEAMRHYQSALQARPDFVEVQVNLASVLQDLDRYQDAFDLLQQALQRRPDLPEAHCNLGYTLEHLGRHPEAIERYRQAIRLRPDYVQAHWNLALACLAGGDWQCGWAEFEWRWAQPGMFPLRSPLPRWDGTPLNGRTILIYDEQGLGDTLQFVRYAAIAKAQGGKVLVRCQRTLMPLLARTPGIDRVLARDEALPPFDVQVPLLSLPGILRTMPNTVPAAVPYLFADPQRISYWREELEPTAGFRVGIVWRGNADQATERFRSVPLEQFARLARIPGVCLFSLQKESGADSAGFPLVDLSNYLTDFQETAAIVANLDLVITRDTAVAHLAGGLGKPVWLALSAVPDWRWMRDRLDSPWYPSMTLFRQRQLGQWAPVFEAIAERLAARGS